MLSDSLVVIFLGMQLFYLLFLTLTNVSMTMFVVISLRHIAGYFFASDNDIASTKIIASNNYRPVSILVPAYNEEKTIVSSVTALLRLHFQEFEVIVINDGSVDGTLEALKREFALVADDIPIRVSIAHQPLRGAYRSTIYENLTVVDKANGGKADALNCGINISHFPLFCCVDADSLLEYDAIVKSIAIFSEDRRAIAVGGKIGIMNGCVIENHMIVERRVPRTRIEAFQVIEYTRGFLAGRTAWDKLGALLIISGAFGVFRKDIVEAIGGYRHTIGEDFDLLIRMHRHCYDNNIDHSVRFVPNTICWTQAPHDYPSLLKQRNRWHRGLLETLYHNRDMIFNPKYKRVGMFALPYFLLVEALSPMITMLGVFSIILFYLFGLINKDAIIIFFLLEFVWGVIINIGSMPLEFFVKHRYKKLRDIFKLIALSFLEPFYYRPLIKVENFMATFNFMNTSWGKVERKSI